MEVRLLALREALAQETASRESEVLRVTEQTAEQARQTAALRTMVGDAVDLIGVLRTENDDLRERFDRLRTASKHGSCRPWKGTPPRFGGVVTHCANSVAGPPARPDFF